MRRLFLILAAVAGVATAAPTALAFARDGDQGRRAERHERGPERGRGWDGERRGRGEDRREWRGRGDGDRRWREDRPRFEERRRDDEGRARRWREPRRGGYLPEGYRGGVVEDYPRYRLRTPPQGYAWVRVGAGFALVSKEDGRIYDMVQ